MPSRWRSAGQQCEWAGCSLTYGGICFYEPSDIGGTNALIGGSVVVPSAGDVMPLASPLVSAHASKDGLFISGGLHIRDTAGGKIANPTVQFANTNAAIRASIDSGGDLRSFLRQPDYAPDSFSSASFSLAVAGSLAGITYSTAPRGSRKTNCSVTTVQLRCVLSSKGAGAGVLTLTGLGKAAQQFDQQYLEVILRNGENTIAIVGRIVR